MKTKLLTHYLERKNERQMREKKHDLRASYIRAKGLLSRANKYMREPVRDSGDTCYVYKKIYISDIKALVSACGTL